MNTAIKAVVRVGFFVFKLVVSVPVLGIIWPLTTLNDWSKSDRPLREIGRENLRDGLLFLGWVRLG